MLLKRATVLSSSRKKRNEIREWRFVPRIPVSNQTPNKTKQIAYRYCTGTVLSYSNLTDQEARETAKNIIVVGGSTVKIHFYADI